MWSMFEATELERPRRRTELGKKKDMSFRSSSISNDSLSLPFGLHCLLTAPRIWVFTVYTFINVLLLPLFVLVLYHGYQRQGRRPSAPTAPTASHTDCFTYHVVSMEILFVLGCILCCCGIYVEAFPMLLTGFYLFSLTWYGETFFQVLTCVDHYLAVVHPLTYLSLKQDRGIRIRNASIGCVWLLSLGGASLIAAENISMKVVFCLLPVCLAIISFCCLSVLCVLVRPRPGGQDRVARSKHRAFCIILAILGVLLLRCVWNMVWGALYELTSEFNECVAITGEVWFTLPSSLVLPLLFVQKVGSLGCKPHVRE